MKANRNAVSLSSKIDPGAREVLEAVNDDEIGFAIAGEDINRAGAKLEDSPLPGTESGVFAAGGEKSVEVLLDLTVYTRASRSDQTLHAPVEARVDPEIDTSGHSSAAQSRAGNFGRNQHIIGESKK